MRTNNNLVTFLLVATLASFVQGCGGGTSSGSSGDSTDSGVSEISDLPKATDPVVDESASASVSKNFRASTGMPIGSEPDFDADTSMAACEMFNQTKNAIQNAAQGDLIMCYIQNTMQRFITQSESTTNIYDGNYHIYNVVFGEDVMKIKFKLQKTNDVITNFEMFMCEPEDDSFTQQEYLSQTISNSTFSMISKGIHEGDNSSGIYQTIVSGRLNADGDFIGEKVITMDGMGEWNGNEHQDHVVFTQSAGSATITGYNEGEFTDNQHNISGSFSNSIYGSVELIDGNTPGSPYNIGLMALGDGAVYGEWSGSDGNGNWGDTFDEGWNGDTLMRAVNDYLADVIDAELLTEAPNVDLSFTSSQSWNCGDQAEATINMQELFGAGVGGGEDEPDIESCSNLQLDHEWINCWELSRN